MTDVKYEVLKRGKVVKTLSAPEDADMIDLLVKTEREIGGVDKIRRADRSSGDPEYSVSVDRKRGIVSGERERVVRVTGPLVPVRIDRMGNVVRDD